MRRDSAAMDITTIPAMARLRETAQPMMPDCRPEGPTGIVIAASIRVQHDGAAPIFATISPPTNVVMTSLASPPHLGMGIFVLERIDTLRGKGRRHLRFLFRSITIQS